MPKRPLDLCIPALTSCNREVGAVASRHHSSGRKATMSATYMSSVRREHHHGILADHRGQDQPTDKSRAQQASLGEEAGEKSQQDVTPPFAPPRDARGRDAADKAAARAEAAAVMDMLWSLTIRAALLAGTPWLDVFCPGCGTSKAIDLRTIDRHPLASVGTLVLGLRCSWCPGSAPMPRRCGGRRLPKRQEKKPHKQ